MSEIYTLDSLHIENIPSPVTIKKEMPALPHHLEFIQHSRNQVVNILEGNDNRLLLIIGPCSIHDISAAKEYAQNLQILAKEVSKSFLIVMRTYFEKPRTALGWKGILNDPHLDGTNDIVSGIKIARQLLLDLAEMEIPAATEFLDPFTPRYLSDLVSWSCIGARTSESQIHRQFASSLPMPVAFKNGTLGNMNIAIKGILTAACPHAFLGIDDHGHISIVRTKGNPHAHVALRGGENSPNYDPHSIGKLLESLRKNHLPERVIVDCSHGNSNRCPEKQKEVFECVIDQYLNGNCAIRGVAVESNLFEGSQRMPLDKSRLQYAVSITDPCLGWEQTEELVRRQAQLIESKQVMAMSEQIPVNIRAE